MSVRPLFEFGLVALLCVVSGNLECGRRLTATQRRGQQLYARMCAVCHAPGGEGYAADRAPALAHPDFLGSASDGYIRDAIADGRRGTTMSAWSVTRSGPLSRSDVDAIVAFMRTWQSEPAAALDERPSAGDAARGVDLFARECVRCHGTHGTGGPDIHVGNPDLLTSASNGFLRHAIQHGRRGTAMPSFSQKIGEAGVDDVVAALRSWQSTPVGTLPIPAPAKIPLGPVPLNPHGPEPVGLRPNPETTPADVVKAQLDRGARMGVLDARAPSDYLASHIAGAVSVPFYDPDPYMSSLPKSAWLVCYCACPHAESGQLARKLAASGFAKVTVLDEGLNVWQARHYPTHAGMDP